MGIIFAPYEVRLQEAAGNGLTHAEFLELVLQDELLVRKERQIKRLIKVIETILRCAYTINMKLILQNKVYLVRFS